MKVNRRENQKGAKAERAELAELAELAGCGLKLMRRAWLISQERDTCGWPCHAVTWPRNRIRTPLPPPAFHSPLKWKHQTSTAGQTINQKHCRLSTSPIQHPQYSPAVESNEIGSRFRFFQAQSEDQSRTFPFRIPSRQDPIHMGGQCGSRVRSVSPRLRLTNETRAISTSIERLSISHSINNKRSFEACRADFFQDVSKRIRETIIHQTRQSSSAAIDRQLNSNRTNNTNDSEIHLKKLAAEIGNVKMRRHVVKNSPVAFQNDNDNDREIIINGPI